MLFLVIITNQQKIIKLLSMYINKLEQLAHYLKACAYISHKRVNEPLS